MFHSRSDFLILDKSDVFIRSNDTTPGSISEIIFKKSELSLTVPHFFFLVFLATADFDFFLTGVFLTEAAILGVATGA